MKKLFFLFFILLTLFSCSDSLPKKEDYIGVYQIIKIDDRGENLFKFPLNHIELTDKEYISRFDKNNNNLFSAEEIIKNSYTFGVDNEKRPFLKVSGNPETIYLQNDSYYDLLFVSGSDPESRITLYTNKVR